MSEPEASTSTHAVAEKLPEGFFDDPKLDAKVLSLLYSYVCLASLLPEC